MAGAARGGNGYFEHDPMVGLGGDVRPSRRSDIIHRCREGTTSGSVGELAEQAMVPQGMRRSWHERNPGLFRAAQKEIPAKYPDLRVTLEGDVVHIRGSYPVMDEVEVLDRFQIEISVPPDFPDSTPVLREIGGRIPWNSDRHVNRDAGEACPIVPEEWLMWPERESILAFLEGPVRNFFLGQVLVEAGCRWPFGERTHGVPGLFEAYGEIVGASDREAILRYLDCLSKEIMKGHWDCPCGSGKRLRNCHRDDLKALHEKTSPLVARSALERLAKYSVRLDGKITS